MRRVETIGDCLLYLGDCLQIAPSLTGVEAIVTDNPYGGGFDFDSRRFTGGTPKKALGPGRGDRRVIGDDEPFDPAPWLKYKEVILWGSNHFASALPRGSTLIWLKKRPQHYGTRLSDAEVGWQKGGYGVYAFHAPDSNGRRAAEAFGSAFAGTAHPTQKPIALMEWCVSRTRGQTILDPYMGSGTTLVACAKLGRKGVGIELDPEYFEVACERVADAYRRPELSLGELG